MASAGTPYRLVPATFTPVGAYSQSLRYEYDRASCDKRSADRDSRKAVKHGNDGESRIQSCAFLCVKCAIGWPRHALECDMIDVPAEATVLCPICRPTVLVMFFFIYAPPAFAIYPHGELYAKMQTTPLHLLSINQARFLPARRCAIAVLAMAIGPASACLSVHHKSEFYRNWWIESSWFWHRSFLRPIIHCVVWKFG